MTVIKKPVIFLAILLLAIQFSYSTDSKIRDYLTSVQWYPRDPGQLSGMLDSFFNHVKSKPVNGRIVGLIGPHAGLGYSGQCAAGAYKQLESLPGIQRVIMLGVSHHGSFYGAVVSDYQYNATPLGNIPVDTEVTAQLAKEELFKKSNELIQTEHSLETHLPFLYYIQNKLNNTSYKIVPILFGYLEPKDIKKVAGIIKKYITPHTLVIASSDFTHYGANYMYVPFKDNIKENLTKLDMGMIDLIRQMDFPGFWQYRKKTGITMCGYIPVGVLINIFSEDHCSVELTDYYKSGDRQNDYSFSVSYASLILSVPQGKPVNQGPGKPAEEPVHIKNNTGDHTMNLNLNEKKTLLSIARHTLEDYFQGKKTTLDTVFSQHRITSTIQEKSGVFVTLRKHGDLRGCIGSIIGVEPLWEGVHNNVLKSAFHDPRFYPLQKRELKDIDIEISVMTPLQPLQDYKKIRLGTDGVVIRKGYHQAVFLPQVATETGWDLDQFLGHLCQKAGLPGQAYEEGGMEFHIFQALVFEENEIKK